MDVELDGGDTPYVDVRAANVNTYVPFRHTLSLYTRAASHPHWTIEKEVNPSMRRVREWEWILELDAGVPARDDDLVLQRDDPRQPRLGARHQTLPTRPCAVHLETN